MFRRISTPLDIYYFRIGINNTVKLFLSFFFFFFFFFFFNGF